MKLTQQADKLTGDLDGDKLEGSFTGYSIHFLAKGDQGGSEEGTATVQGDSMYGTIIYVDVSNPSHPVSFPFTARLAADLQYWRKLIICHFLPQSSPGSLAFDCSPLATSHSLRTNNSHRGDPWGIALVLHLREGDAIESVLSPRGKGESR